MYYVIRGEILRPPENSVSLTIVFGYSTTKKLGIYCMGSIEKNIMILSKYSLDRNKYHCFAVSYTIYPRFFLVAEYYGWRNTIFWGPWDLTSDPF
jgi:hypothetical protein